VLCFHRGPPVCPQPGISDGSKRHLLSSLFANPEAPLNGWGTDLEFQAIPYDEFHPYIQERSLQNNLTITDENARYLQDLAVSSVKRHRVFYLSFFEKFNAEAVEVAVVGSLDGDRVVLCVDVCVHLVRHLLDQAIGRIGDQPGGAEWLL
jgi:hypothetical protein